MGTGEGLGGDVGGIRSSPCHSTPLTPTPPLCLHTGWPPASLLSPSFPISTRTVPFPVLQISPQLHHAPTPRPPLGAPVVIQ